MLSTCLPVFESSDMWHCYCFSVQPTRIERIHFGPVISRGRIPFNADISHWRHTNISSLLCSHLKRIVPTTILLFHSTEIYFAQAFHGTARAICRICNSVNYSRCICCSYTLCRRAFKDSLHRAFVCRISMRQYSVCVCEIPEHHRQPG